MPIFAYKAKAQDGKLVTGLLNEKGEKDARGRLRMRKMVTLELGPAPLWSMATINKMLERKGRVTSKDLVVFSRQFSTMIGAGVPLVHGLSILEAQCPNPAFKDVLCDVRSSIEEGQSISEALERHPEVFPRLYTSMIRAGELGGILDIILKRLTDYLEASEALRAKVRSALMYPGIVMAICAIVALFLLVFVIPTFERVFASFGAELPALSRIIIDLSRFLRDWFIVVLLLPIAAFKGFLRFYATPGGSRFVDWHILKIPIIGIILTKVAVAKFTSTLGTLLRSGVPILQALETVAAVAGNTVISDAVLSSRDSITGGGRLTDPLRDSGVFPDMVVSMIALGEETGSLDIMLEKIAEFYDMEVDAEVKGLTSTIEPLVIVFMGIIVGTLVMAMFLPIIGISEVAGNI